MLKIGDTIKCSTPEDAAEYDMALMKDGYITDYLFEMNGAAGIWIEILGREEDDA